jgi:heme/copper-type cytochrome/quinol oxidase subunit 3
MAIDDDVYSLSIYAWCICANVLCPLMTFILIFSSVTMVLAVDAGHQMKKRLLFICFNHHRWRIFVGSQAWEWKNFIKGEYGAIETKEVVYFSLWIKKVIVF